MSNDNVIDFTPGAALEVAEVPAILTPDQALTAKLEQAMKLNAILGLALLSQGQQRAVHLVQLNDANVEIETIGPTRSGILTIEVTRNDPRPHPEAPQ